MDSSNIIASIGIGAGIFFGLIIFWFFHTVIKRKLGADQSMRAIHTAQTKAGADQRRHPRIEVSWSAAMEFGRMSVNVCLKNISLGGAFVICQEPVPLDNKLRIYVEIPNQERLALNAEVVWSNMNMPESKVIHRGLGVKFVQNTEAVRSRLGEAIAYHESVADVVAGQNG
ncbi:MAG: PilZ domain-containing protein [Desulfobacterales bacterium]